MSIFRRICNKKYQKKFLYLQCTEPASNVIYRKEMPSRMTLPSMHPETFCFPWGSTRLLITTTILYFHQWGMEMGNISCVSTTNCACCIGAVCSKFQTSNDCNLCWMLEAKGKFSRVCTKACWIQYRFINGCVNIFVKKSHALKCDSWKTGVCFYSAPLLPIIKCT